LFNDRSPSERLGFRRLIFVFVFYLFTSAARPRSDSRLFSMPNASDFNNFAARLQPMLLFQSIHIFKIKLLLSSLLVIWTILRLRTVARTFSAVVGPLVIVERAKVFEKIGTVQSTGEEAESTPVKELTLKK
ncbi:unnamed protein product, partial [Brassica napus]